MNSAASHNRVVLVFLALVLAAAIIDLAGVLRITNNHDFAVYYNAALRLRNGEDIFAEADAFRAQIEAGVSTKNEDTPWPFAYPPFLAAPILPLSFLPYAWASIVWTGLILLTLAASCWLALRSQNWLSASGVVLVLLLLYQFQPAVVAVRLGQMDVMIFLLLTLAFCWLKTGNDGKAGLALAVAIGMKFFAAFIVAYLLWKRRWRAALIGGIGGALLAAGSFAVVGLDGIRRYLDFSSIYTGGAFAGYPYHQSFNAFFARTFKANMFTPPLADLPWLATTLTIASSVAAVAGLLWLTRRPTAVHAERFGLEYALVVTTLLLVVPPSPRYSFIYLLLCFIIVAAHVVRTSRSLIVVGALALSYVLSARLIYFPVRFLARIVMDGQFMLSALILWGLIAWLLIRPAEPRGAV